MAKMAYTIGLFLPCLYLQFPFKKFVQQFEESQTLYDTVESEFYSLIIAECQKERIFFDHADLEMHIGNVEQYRKFYVKHFLEPYSQNPSAHLTDRRPELVNCKIENS